jgi:hypothetical protein
MTDLILIKLLFSNLKSSIAEFYAKNSRLDTSGIIDFKGILNDSDLLNEYLNYSEPIQNPNEVSYEAIGFTESPFGGTSPNHQGDQSAEK